MSKVKPLHILVKNQYEADDILRMLKSGKSFADLARKFSICPSAQNDGYLGEVDSRRLDSDFLEAFESLADDEISKPIKTRFGWHLIKK